MVWASAAQVLKFGGTSVGNPDAIRQVASIIDLGGGLGLPYSDDETEIDIENLANHLNRLLEDHEWFTGRLILEPGRWISGPAGLYVCQILEIKKSQGTRFAIMDGGIHHLLRPALIGQNQPYRILPRSVGHLPEGPPEPITFGGPLCTGIDVLSRDVRAPSDLREGDLIAFCQAGAYGETESMPDFLLHPRAKVGFLEELSPPDCDIMRRPLEEQLQGQASVGPDLESSRGKDDSHQDQAGQNSAVQNSAGQAVPIDGNGYHQDSPIARPPI